MDKKKAEKKMKRMQRMYKLFYRKKTSAAVRHVDTSYGKIRVLEYGFDSEEVRPLYVDIHGGGYCLGFPEIDEEVNLFIMGKADVKIISIDYPKAPEHPYPIGQEATYEVIRHYYDNAENYRIDKGCIGVGGYSSGGNFAAVMTMKAKERNDLEIKYQMLCYPGTDISGDPYGKSGSTKVLDGEFIEAIRLCYITDAEQAKQPYASPRLAPKEMLTGLPPVLLILGSIDPLFHEGKEYGDNLKAAGVDTDIQIFEGSDHGFTHFGKEDKNKAFELIAEFIKKHTAG